MPVLTASIETDVPVSFADREWREFVGRSVFGSYPEGHEDLRSSLADLDADDGTVRFADLGPNWTRVSVELEYRSPAAGADLERVQHDLDRELGKFREFAVRRCGELACRR